MFCPSVRFARSQGLSYTCTGFLVGPDLIATAGHCMVNTGDTRNETEMYCKAYSWLFDYRQDVNSQNIDPANHYKCKRVICAVKDERAPFRDFALVQLERPVTGRCDVLNRCSDSGTNCLENDSDTSIFPGYQGIGSEVQRIAPIAQLMRQLRSSSR